MKRKTIDTPYGKLNIRIFNYLNNGRIGIFLFDSNDELYGDLTINLPDIPVPDDSYVFINSNMQTESGKSVIDELKKVGIIDFSVDELPYNLGIYELVKINLNKLKEYDVEGFNNYLLEKTKYNEFGKISI